MAPRVAVVSVADAVTDHLRRRILSGELPPGTTLGEAQVADMYEIARPTAKAAIEHLVRERILQRQAHKAARVTRLRPDDVRDIYRSRALIEAEVVRTLARERRVPEAARAANHEILALQARAPVEVVLPDMRFHRSLVDAVGSERTSLMFELLASEVVFCMSQVQGASLLTPALIAAEHGRILDLIEQGNGEEAADVLAEHLARARERLAERLGGVAGPEAGAPPSTHVEEDGLRD